MTAIPETPRGRPLELSLKLERKRALLLSGPRSGLVVKVLPDCHSIGIPHYEGGQVLYQETGMSAGGFHFFEHKGHYKLAFIDPAELLKGHI